jgi:hypothetical protein
MPASWSPPHAFTMPKRLSTLVNIALNYGFIENFRQSGPIGAAKSEYLQKKGEMNVRKRLKKACCI